MLFNIVFDFVGHHKIRNIRKKIRATRERRSTRLRLECLYSLSTHLVSLQFKISPWYLYYHSNLEIGAHVESNPCYLICLRHLIWSRAVSNRIFFSPQRPIYLLACATYSELPSNVSTIKISDFSFH